MLSVEGDLSSATENSVAQIADLIYVDNITFSNVKGDGRYASKLLFIHCAIMIDHNGVNGGVRDICLLMDLLPLWQSRYSRNWLKIRAWSLTQYDGIIMMDSDMTVIGNLQHLFNLPTSFAAVLDNSKTANL